MNYPLPVFEGFKVDDIWDFQRAEKICFTLINGVNSIECEIKAKRIVESFDVPVNSDPQNNVDRDFEYLQVDCETEVLVELDCVQKIKLTEKQAYDLNEYLKDEMKMIT